MTEEVKAEAAAEAGDGKQEREYGFTLLVSKDGKINITPHNLVNDFEFIGLAQYVDAKKTELLQTLGQTLEFKAVTATSALTELFVKALSASAEAEAAAEAAS